MQRVTRSKADNTLVQVEDPEQILRERRRSMADQAAQDRGNPREIRDSDGEEYSKAKEVNIRDLYRCTRLEQHTPTDSYPKRNGTE